MRISREQTAKCLELAGGMPAKRTPAKATLAPAVRICRTFGLTIPGLVVVSEANKGGPLWAKIKRKTALKEAVQSALHCLQSWRPPEPPFRVAFHRLGQKLLDDDNLAHAFKAVRDTVAGWLEVDDGDTERISFAYSQEQSKTVGIKITIEEV